jgi:hypothetical protein
MLKRIAPVVFVLAVLLVPAAPAPVLAQSGIQVIENYAVPEYPSYIIFLLEVESQLEVTDIRINYRVERDSFVDVVSEAKVAFTQTNLSVSWTWDMYKTGNLPPGTVVEYWWKVSDFGGHQLVTEPQRVAFDDARYQWQDLAEGQITLKWYNGSQQFATELMEVARSALARLEEDTGAHLDRSIDVYIYGSAAELQRAMLFVQDWAGGLAFTGYGVLAIGIAPSDLEWGKRAMVHELAHLVTHQMTHNPYNSIPVWLNEGISKFAEGELEGYSEQLLHRAVDDGDLISVQSLSSPFSAHADKTSLSYAQSYSLVEYLVNRHGPDKMAQLLETFRQGSNADDALMEVYGFDVDGLDRQWQIYIHDKYGLEAPASMGLHPALLFLLLPLVGLPYILKKLRQRVAA